MPEFYIIFAGTYFGEFWGTRAPPPAPYVSYANGAHDLCVRVSVRLRPKQGRWKKRVQLAAG